MLVIDLVESEVFDDPFHVKELNDEDSIVLETFPNALGDGMQFFKVEEHTGGVDEVEL